MLSETKQGIAIDLCLVGCMDGDISLLFFKAAYFEYFKAVVNTKEYVWHKYSTQLQSSFKYSETFRNSKDIGTTVFGKFQLVTVEHQIDYKTSPTVSPALAERVIQHRF